MTEPLRLQDITNFADDLMVATVETIKDGRDLPPAARALWNASSKLSTSNDPSVQRLGYLLGFDAMLAANVTDRVFLHIRSLLIEHDPALELIGDRALEVDLSALWASFKDREEFVAAAIADDRVRKVVLAELYAATVKNVATRPYPEDAQEA
jgi:hypothetical protein